MRKLNQEDFINSCKIIHNNKYNYSLVEYKNTRSKIKIICPDHGIFEQGAKHHKQGHSCPRCVGRNQSTQEFIDICNKKHNNKYKYFINSEFVKSDDYIKILNTDNGLYYTQLSDNHKRGYSPTLINRNSLIEKLCEIHNNKYVYLIDKEHVYITNKIKIVDKETEDEFFYRVDRHLLGMKPSKITLNYLKIEGSKIHNNKYLYLSIIRSKGECKAKIICPLHGEFIQDISNHILNKTGCPTCAGNGKWDKDEIIEEFKKIHFNKYDYSLVRYENTMGKICIICQIHGNFYQVASKHLCGQGCKLCSSNSKGEEYVKMYLSENNIEYIQQHGFDTCKYINRLNFDFYLPKLNTCIEFDGIQHFKPIKDFGGEKGFIDVKNRDECKNKWCLENGVSLIRIKYDKISKISEILNKKLLKK